MPKQKFYVVWKGRKTGIFTSWAECAAQVNGFHGAEYKSFESQADAKKAFEGAYESYVSKLAPRLPKPAPTKMPVVPSISVDAACSGAPGPVEYRGVDTETGRELFRQGPFASGTNNVGEFLAIVHGLAWLEKNGLDLPVYSDSRNAIAWVKAGVCRTKLLRNERNVPLFDLIARAEEKLKSLKDGKTFKLLKWDTRAWGENPADFGRK